MLEKPEVFFLILTDKKLRSQFENNEATIVQLLENTLRENKLIKEENKEIRNQLTSVEFELREVKLKIDESLSRTLTHVLPEVRVAKIPYPRYAKVLQGARAKVDGRQFFRFF